MKHIYSYIFFLSLSLIVHAQTHLDSMRSMQMEIGYQNDYQFIGLPLQPSVKLDFRNSPPQVIIGNRNRVPGGHFGSICNVDGEIIFFSSGQCVYKPDGTHINGNHVVFQKSGCSQSTICEPSDEVCKSGTVGILPQPNNPNRFILLGSEFYDASGYWFANRFYYSILETTTANPNGQLLSVGNDILSNVDSFILEPKVCKHANGRDWWIFMFEGLKLPRGRRFLLTPNGIEDRGWVYLPRPMYKVFATFSPNGNTFANFIPNAFDDQITARDSLFYMDFDRCSGEFSNFRSIAYQRPSLIQGIDFLGFDFSPDSRFVYALSELDKVLQFDISSTPTVSVVGNVDNTFLVPNRQGQGASPLYFAGIFLGPNGKVYIGGSPLYFENPLLSWFHEISSPNIPGRGCNLVQRAISIPAPAGIPAPPPHYALGPLRGSGCDTLSAVSEVAEAKDGFSVYPNPASQVFHIKYKSTQKEANVVLSDLLGRVRIQEMMEFEDGKEHAINISSLPAGVYAVQVLEQGQVMHSDKLVIVR